MEPETTTTLGAPNREAEINFIGQILTGFWVMQPGKTLAEVLFSLFPGGTDVSKASDQEVLDAIGRELTQQREAVEQ